MNKLQSSRVFMLNIILSAGCLLFTLSANIAAHQVAAVTNLQDNLNLCDVKQQPTYDVAFSPRQGSADLIISTIMTAKKTVYVAAFAFTSQPVADALVAVQKRGVIVKVLLDKKQANDKNTKLNFLKNNKIEVRTGNSKMMHNKYMIIDSSSVQTGSFNYSNSAENSNAENVLVIYDAPNLAQKYENNWNKLWGKAK